MFEKVTDQRHIQETLTAECICSGRVQFTTIPKSNNTGKIVIASCSDCTRAVAIHYDKDHITRTEARQAFIQNQRKLNHETKTQGTTGNVATGTGSQ
jgi:hypothetical protein